MEKVSLDKSSKEELSEIVRSFPVLYNKSRKEFKEIDAVKNAWNGVTTALDFNLTVNYFHFNSFTSFFEIVLFISLNQLVPGVPNLYPQCLSFTLQNRSQMFLKLFSKISQYW